MGVNRYADHALPNWQSNPHARGGEPLPWVEKEAINLVIPTPVGVNRIENIVDGYAAT